MIDYYVGALKKMILEDDNESLNLTIFEDKINIDDIIDACDTFPVFAERKLVIVKNSGLFLVNQRIIQPLQTMKI